MRIVSHQDSPELFANIDWDPVPSFYDQVSYDAMIALGIGRCDTEEFPTGPDVVDAIKATEFVGTSGLVSFDNFTRTRAAESVTFRVINLLVDPSEDSIEYSAWTTSIINLATNEVKTLSTFAYTQGTSEPPPPLPPLTVEYNLLGNGI